MGLQLAADLRLDVDVPGAAPVSARLTGTGTALTLEVDEPFVFAGRRDAGAIRGMAAGLAERGLTVTVVGPSGPLVSLGACSAPWVQRLVTRSRHIRIEKGAGLWSLARGRAQSSDVSALPAAELAPPLTVWPPAPTFLRRRRVVTTTHDPDRGGNPRLVTTLSAHPGPDERPTAFRLRRPVTTIGSAADCDVRLPGLAARHAEVLHDEDDEFVLIALEGAVRVHGAPAQRALLRNGTRIELGGRTLVYAREEYADHGRPYGGRIGGELGRQRSQPPRSELQRRQR
jgi:hypothetical protein